MRIIKVVSTLILGLSMPMALHGQVAKGGFASRTEVALDYNYLRGKTLPAPTFQSSGYSMSGVSATGAYEWRWRLSAVADFSGTHVNGVGQSGLSLTILTSTVGARYRLPPMKAFHPFLQVLAGEAHATGGIYKTTTQTGGGADAVAVIAGAGIDHPLNHVVSLRVGASYLYTGLPNASSNYQSFLRADGGLVIHFGAR